QARDVDQGLQGGHLVQGQGPFADIDRQVAHAFQVRVDLHGTGDEAHVPGHGLVQGQQAVADLVDFDLQVVDVPVALDDPAGKLAVPVHDGLDGEADGFLHAAT